MRMNSSGPLCLKIGLKATHCACLHTFASLIIQDHTTHFFFSCNVFGVQQFPLQRLLNIETTVCKKRR